MSVWANTKDWKASTCDGDTDYEHYDGVTTPSKNEK